MQSLIESNIIDFHQNIYVKTHKYTFKWTMKDINKYGNNEVKSSSFKPDNKKIILWGLSLSIDKTITLRLDRKSASNVPYKCEFKIQVSDSNNKIWLDECKVLEYIDTNNSYESVISGLDPLLEDIKQTGKDTIIVTLLLKMHEKVYETIEYLPSEQILQRQLQETLAKDLNQLFENQVNTDVLLKVSGTSIGAHKSILSARSPVFAKMFQQDMSETETNVIDVKDITPFALKELVAFLYGKYSLNYDFEMCLDVYYAADKYQVAKLKEVCGALLASKSNEHNAGRVLKLADLHNDAQLKINTMKFIRPILKSCIKMDWWEELMMERSPLAKELEQFLVESMF